MAKVEGLSKIEFKELLSLATKESYFIFNGNSTSKSMESLRVHLQVQLWLMLWLKKRIGYKIVHLTLSLINTVVC